VLSSSDVTQAEEIDYSIIVPAFNEEEYLPATLQSLDACMERIEGATGEIIVVDNNSDDRTALVAKSNGARVVHEKIRGIGRARNSGAEQARGQVFFFVDADTSIPASIFQEAYQLSRHGRAGAGGATLRFDRIHGKIFFGLLVPKFWNWVSKTFRLAAGSFVFCRKDLFLQCGGFPGDIYAGEEVFFSRKVKEVCKNAGREFRVFGGERVVTSSRKLLWHSNLKIFLSMLLLIVFPLSVRYRKLCHFWYERPDGKR
jgi:glycosyltransferase involved in cell wall biosynthesis